VPRNNDPPGEGVQSVVLALRIIEHVTEMRRPVGVTALATALGMNKSRIHRHLQTLVARGYLSREEETDRYGTGARLVSLGRRIVDNVDLVDVAMPVLRGLRDALGHYSVLSQLEEEGVRVMASVSGRSLVEIGVRRGSLLLFHASAQGKVALAYGPEETRHRVLRSRLEMLTSSTIVSPVQLEQELERIRARGWATGFNESLLGLNTLAAPVFDAPGNLVGAIGIVDSIQFIEESPSEHQIRETMDAAARVSEMLGYQGTRAEARPARRTMSP
jgi:IclR family transcriptional regulator, KDG regulon repressor